MGSPDKTKVLSEGHLKGGQYFGNVLAKWDCSDLVIAEVQHTEGKSHTDHTHELSFFSMMLGGGYTEHLGSKTVDYKQLSVVFREEGLLHSDHIPQCGVRLFNVEMKGSWKERLRQIAPLKGVSV